LSNILFVALFVAEVPPEEVERALAGARGEMVRTHMEFLADDLLEGRDTGARGYDLATRYVAAQLTELGVAPLGDDRGYFQSLDIVEAREMKGSAELTLRRGGRAEPLVFGEDFLIGGQPREESRVEAPVVYVGHGITAPSLHHDDYRDVDVKGKIVAYFAGAPGSLPQVVRTHFSPAGFSIPNLDKLENAERRGASGVLVLTSPSAWERRARELQSTGANRYWLGPDGTPGVAPRAVKMMAFVSPTGARKIFDGSPFSPDELSAEATRGRATPLELALELSARQSSHHLRLRSANVLGWLEGSDPALKHEYVVYSAHLDHVGIGEAVDGDAIYNGAYDMRPASPCCWRWSVLSRHFRCDPDAPSCSPSSQAKSPESWARSISPTTLPCRSMLSSPTSISTCPCFFILCRMS
jgi:hypothetical protein